MSKGLAILTAGVLLATGNLTYLWICQIITRRMRTQTVTEQSPPQIP